MKKVLVSGYIGFDNFGDEAIFYALSNHLKSMNIDVSVLCNNTKITQEKYGTKTYYYKDIFSIFKAIANTDILISGGGSLLQNKTSNFSLYYYLFILFIAKLFFKKTVIFAQGIEPVNGKINENILKFVLKTVDFISVRDEVSKLYLKKLNIDSTLLSDAVYSILQETKISDKKSGLVVQLRKTKNINREFVKFLAKQISKNFKGNIKILSLQDSFDKEICEQLKCEFENLNVPSEVILNSSIKNTIEILNNAQYTISTRLHGAIVSNALKTCTFTLNYDEKLKTLSNELGIQNINLDCFNYDEFEEKLDKFFNTETKFSEYRKFDWKNIDSILN